MRVNLSPIQGSCMQYYKCWHDCMIMSCMHTCAVPGLPDSLGLARGGTQRMEKS